jgi:hypothetical protein
MITSLFILPTVVLLFTLLFLLYYLMPPKPFFRWPFKKQKSKNNEREIRSILLKQLQTLNELHTALGTIQVLVTGEDTTTSFGIMKKSNKILYVAFAKVRAGVDLSKLDENSIQTVNGQLKIRIPEAELFDVFLDLDKSFVHDAKSYRLTPASLAFYEETQCKALEAVRREAYASGVLQLAQEQAEATIEQLVELMPGFRQQDVAVAWPKFQPSKTVKNDQAISNAEAVTVLYPMAEPG